MVVSRLFLKSALCAVVALLFALTMNQSAYAWTWGSNVTVYSVSGLCVQGSAGIDHAQPNVFSGNLAYANTYALGTGCVGGLTKSGNAAAVRLDVERWNGSAWVVCRSTDWLYGPTGVSGGDTGGPYGPSQVYNYGGAASCGAGYYGTLAYAYVTDGTAWRGGSVWSGYEYVS
ncbi:MULTISPECIES: hypothetical protein [unclassified Streptomyces]|uniref:hypothetical protein n=1 Tax=unclassified Streptomyces TaxID=2593676 RepID=UPI002E29D016|nr:hypothetical protein [Streptomyces sp. NBC_00223]